ncbi:Cobalt-precorrin-8X methylmutase [Pluralibacter gergoviae]|nr:Cobalt-precorrin-8X methylmutase [Pluralibacter gergoviae]
MHYIQQPGAIEAKSFDIISETIRDMRPDYQFASPLHEAIIKRGDSHHRRFRLAGYSLVFR